MEYTFSLIFFFDTFNICFAEKGDGSFRGNKKKIENKAQIIELHTCQHSHMRLRKLYKKIDNTLQVGRG